MASVVIDLRTSYRRGEISHMDVALIHGTDTTLNRFTIIPTVPDTAPGRDLTDPLRIVQFDNVQDSASYSYVFRLYLNRDPRFEIRSESFNTGAPVCRGRWFWRSCSPRITAVNVLINE